MSEEILKALMQLFAIITKQDGGVTEKEKEYVVSFLKQQLSQEYVNEYLLLYDEFSDFGKTGQKERKLTSVRDSVRTLSICKKINKTLTQKQKVVVLIRLFELINADKEFSNQSIELLVTVSKIFNIDINEYNLIKDFISHQKISDLDLEEILVISKNEQDQKGKHQHLFSPTLNNEIGILNVRSVDLYFVRYIGDDEIYLNGLIVKKDNIYLFPHGSIIKLPKDNPVHYSDVTTKFLHDKASEHISFHTKALKYRFPNGKVGFKDINIIEDTGKLIGIMGASGSGKTTLLNVLAGLEQPSRGKVKINNINIHTEKKNIEGVIGYIAQDDLLMEELTVYQNLFYNAKLCFKNLNKKDISQLVSNTLNDLGLAEIKHIKVGSVLNKKISGGQRKRLNIALELIREPSVLFVDEPTSGLSSRDSENVITLLKDLALKGKLLFVVIHQPSSDIFKMFDKILLLDVGGVPIFYGSPVEAIIYFKTLSNQLNSEHGQCPECGNVNPEIIFNIIEANIVDEYGQFTGERKVSSQEWHEHFKDNIKLPRPKPAKQLPKSSLKIPSIFKQLVIFIKRDVLSKVANRQYLLINLLEAPILAFILAFIIRFSGEASHKGYVFYYNDNIPAYLLMTIVVALFIGLTVSAEEIFKDRKILKREKFLNLSRSSYLLSKTAILFFLSAMQMATFVLIGNWVLEIKGMDIEYWLALFSIACFANVLGLNISDTFDSAVTIYIIIPLLIIPQMILSGAIFNFDKLNEYIGSKEKVPISADLMASRWAFEALAVNQFKNNKFEILLYDYDKIENLADLKQVYIIPELQKRAQKIERNLKQHKEVSQVASDIIVLNNELEKETAINPSFPFKDKLTKDNISLGKIKNAKKYLSDLSLYYTKIFNQVNSKKDRLIYMIESDSIKAAEFKERKELYYNKSLADLVENKNVAQPVIEYKNHLVSQIMPIYRDPENTKNIFNYRAHFFAPRKHFMGNLYPTFSFNIIAIWIMSIALYIMLYFSLFRKSLLWLNSRFRSKN